MDLALRIGVVVVAVASSLVVREKAAGKWQSLGRAFAVQWNWCTTWFRWNSLEVKR